MVWEEKPKEGDTLGAAKKGCQGMRQENSDSTGYHWGTLGQVTRGAGYLISYNCMYPCLLSVKTSVKKKSMAD